MEPILDHQIGQPAGDVEMWGGEDSAPPLSAVNLLADMYYRRQSLDPHNVSLQSSFICMLHLANEEGLRFEQENTFAGNPRLQTLAESDFTIRKVKPQAGPVF